MINLKRELGSKYTDIEKTGVAKELEKIVNNDNLININIDDIKDITKGEIVGALSKKISNINTPLEITTIKDAIPTDCLLIIECSKTLGLGKLDIIISNIRKMGTNNMNINIGTVLNDDMKDEIKVLIIFSHNEFQDDNTDIMNKEIGINNEKLIKKHDDKNITSIPIKFSNENELLYIVASFIIDNDLSVNSIQQYFGLSFIRIFNILKTLEELGIISKYDNENQRKVLITDKEKIKELINYASSSKIITSITIKGLFGIHSYKLIFNEKEPISIIYGTNGMGKTTIFKILNSLLIEHTYGDELSESKNYDNFRYLCDELLFDEFIIDFADGSSIEVHKDNNVLYINYLRKKGLAFNTTHEVLMISTSDIKVFKKSVIEHFKRVNDLFLCMKAKERFLFVNTSRDGKLVKIARKLADIQNEFCLKYLGSFFDEKKESSFVNLYNDVMELKDIVNKENTVDLQEMPGIMFEELNMIHDTYKAYQTCFEYDSASNKKDTPIFIYEENYEKFIYLTKNMDIKEKIGNFMIETDDSKIPYYDETYICSYEGFDDGVGTSAVQLVDEFNLNIDELYEHIIEFELFKNSFENFYNKYDPSYKKIKLLLNDNPRFEYECSNGSLIDETKLSSGEINLLSILYSIAFKASQDTIVLIDEPEISLHPLWVQQITDTILKMVNKKKNMQVIMSSHSPFLSAGHEEYLVEGELLEEGE